MSTDGKRFQLRQEYDTWAIVAEFDVEEEPEGEVNPNLVRLNVARVLSHADDDFRDKPQKAHLHDRHTGHYYELLELGGSPDTWTWRRLTWAIAPVQASDAMAVFVNQEAPIRWEETDQVPGFDRRTFLNNVFGQIASNTEAEQFKDNLR